MADNKVSFNTVHKAVKEFKKNELDKQVSIEERLKQATAMMEIAGAYLKDNGIDVTKPFDADAFIQGAKGRAERNRREEVTNAFKLAKQRVDEIHQKEKEAAEKISRREAERREAERREAFNMSRPVNEDKEWYSNTFKNGMRRPGGGDEITDSNPLDWQRLRVLRDGKLVPVMGDVHFGPPNALQIELLRDEAKKGNLFLYRLGEEYPQHLVGNTWYSTDPTIREDKPVRQIPDPPKAPQPFTTTLEDELRARNLSPLLVNISSAADIKNEDARNRYMEAREAFRSKEAAFLKARKQYQQDLKEYEALRTRLIQEHDAKVQEWSKKVSAYDKLSIDIKRAINNEAPLRNAEIMRNQEKQRAADIDKQPHLDWYHNVFRKSMVRPSGAADLVEGDGMDWGRIRIWDGEKFARALPEGHTGIPSAETLKNLREAAQSGNLFMYQRGDKYPSKWTGRDWSSMDKSWIEKSRPTPVKNMKGLPEKPVNRAGGEPQLKNYTDNISSVKMAIHRRFSFAFKAEAQRYQDAKSNYEAQKQRYDNALAVYNQEMERYNEEMDALEKGYQKRMGVYENMLKNYESLSQKQREAMEKDAAQRTEEIKNNKENQVKKAEDSLVQEQNIRNLLDAANKRMEAVAPRPEQNQFLNPAGVGQQPLGKNAYEMIAPRGYDLSPDSRITPEEASMIHIALAGSAQAAMNGGLSPMSAEQYGQMLDGVLYGRPSEGDWKYIAASYDTAKGCINSYENGDPKELADALSAGLRNLVAVGRGRLDLTPEMAGLAKLTERILDVMDRHQELLENCTLNKEEMNFARGMVELGHIYNNGLAAKMELTKHAAGAQTLTPEQMQTHMTDLFINKAAGNVIKNDEMGAVAMVNTMGRGSHVINTVRNAYQNDPTLQNFSNNPQNRNMRDLEKQVQGLAGAVSRSSLAQPRESVQLREQVRNQVKEHLEQNSPEAREARKREEQLETLEREQVRYLLAQADPKYEIISLRDPLITQTLKDLREARDILEARDNQQYEKLTFRKKDTAANDAPQVKVEGVVNQNQRPDVVVDGTVKKTVAATKESLRGYADREEYKNLKADDLIEVDGSVSGKRYELFDPAVRQEAIDRADVRALMQQENAQRRQEKKSELPINDFTMGRRLNELRAAQKQLTVDGKAPALTSAEVIGKAMENRDARAQRLRGPITEMLQAQDVYMKEKGLQVDDNGRWPVTKVQGEVHQVLGTAKTGLKKQGTGEPFYRSEEVQKRLEQLQKARAALGPRYQNARLNHPAVIRKSYMMEGIDPAKFGIQSPDSMTNEQRKEYDERMQTIDHLRTVDGVEVSVANRGDYTVDQRMQLLQVRRREYEGLPGAEKNLPLNDPRIYAASIARDICVTENKPMNYTVRDIAALGEQIKGKPKAQAEQIVQQFMENPQARIQQEQIQQQQQLQPQAMA